MSRPHVLRKSIKTHDKDAFLYPFARIRDDDYKLEDILNPLLTQKKEEAAALAGDFPCNITEWIWSIPGEYDENPWLLLCRLNTGAYAFYRAGCDGTGFDCLEEMELTVSNNLEDIVEHGMYNCDYVQYEAETILS